MRKLIWIVVTLAVVYGGYWVVGSRAALGAMETALVRMKADGRGDFAAVSIRGFPSRFDFTIDRPRLVSADGRSSWSADFVQLLALSYRPNQVIAIWPDRQDLVIDGVAITLTAEDLRASVATEPILSLPLDHAELEGHQVVVGLPLGAISVEKLILAARRGARGLNSHDVALVLTRPGVDGVLHRVIDPRAVLPATADELRIEATAAFDRRIDRTVLDTPARLTALNGIDATLAWGPSLLRVTGDLSADGQGGAQGDLRIVADGWEQLLTLAVGAGLVPRESERQLRQIFAVMAQGGERPGRLEVPLTFDGGRISVGAVDLGPVPRF